MYQHGDLNSMWSMAKQTNLTFDLVRVLDSCGETPRLRRLPAPRSNAAACMQRVLGQGHGVGMRPAPVRSWPNSGLPPHSQVTFVVTCSAIVFAAATYLFTRTRPVYLMNYYCYKPPPEYVVPCGCFFWFRGGVGEGAAGNGWSSLARPVVLSAPCTAVGPEDCGSIHIHDPGFSLRLCRLKVTHEYFMEHSKKIGVFSEDSLEFQRKVLAVSGLGQETYLPACERLHVLDSSFFSCFVWEDFFV